MQPTSQSGYELCYLEGRQSVSVSDATSDNDFDFGAPIGMPAEGLLTWGRTAFAVVVVAVLITLGIANVAMYSRWHEVEDGVLWGSRAEGVTALDVATGCSLGHRSRNLAVARSQFSLHLFPRRHQDSPGLS